MNYRRLGQAGIKLSEIGLGSWLTYGAGVNERTSHACIRRAFDLGVNFFDTADVYHQGAAEETYGRELGAFRRQDLVIATKCFFSMSDAVNDRGLSRKHVFESVAASLKRLRTDYIDLYQCHRFDADVELFELVRAMDDLIRQGKILYWGVSEWSPSEIKDVCALARQLNACPPVSNQPEYSITARRVETSGVQDACRAERLGMVVWSPLAQGVLSGKYSGGKVPTGSRAASDKMNVFLHEISSELTDRVDRLRPIADRRGMTLAQLALAWLLRRAAVTSVIIGATKVTQVEENVAATEFELTDEDLTEIDALFPAEQFPG
jgi:voltage-dependent potassium channel beta subunit